MLHNAAAGCAAAGATPWPARQRSLPGWLLTLPANIAVPRHETVQWLVRPAACGRGRAPWSARRQVDRGHHPGRKRWQDAPAPEAGTRTSSSTHRAVADSTAEQLRRDLEQANRIARSWRTDQSRDQQSLPISPPGQACWRRSQTRRNGGCWPRSTPRPSGPTR